MAAAAQPLAVLPEPRTMANWLLAVAPAQHAKEKAALALELNPSAVEETPIAASSHSAAWDSSMWPARRAAFPANHKKRVPCASGGYRCERWIPAIYREPLGHHTRAIRQQVLRVVVVTEPRERAVPDRPTELGV